MSKPFFSHISVCLGRGRRASFLPELSYFVPHMPCLSLVLLWIGVAVYCFVIDDYLLTLPYLPQLFILEILPEG